MAKSRVPRRSTGSGVIVGENAVLTSAHVVANATFLQVQRSESSNKPVARVSSLCHDCDLALLEVEGPHFMDRVEPVEIGDLPNLRDRVAVMGFPVGGDEVSVTEGVVSRIEVQRYSHSQRCHLAITVDAAINKGNSGGPVFKDGRVVGIAFQGLSQADGIGELVPPPLIQHFLCNAKQHARVDLPALGISCQNLENPALRARLGMDDQQSGLLVVDVDYESSAWGVLHAGDALLAIGEHRLANNGTVRYRHRHRCHYDVLLSDKHVGDPLPITILRAGQMQTVELTLQRKTDLVPRSRYEHSPTYFVFGGLVFQTLCRDFLATWSNWWEKAPKEFLHLYRTGRRTPERTEVVVLSQVLADEVNVGYEHLDSESVHKVNGEAPRDMRHFVDQVTAASGFLELELGSGRRIVLHTEEARRRAAAILARYHIHKDRSGDL